MKTLLRSCFAADPYDKLDLLLANYRLLARSPVPRNWGTQEDSQIWKSIEDFVATHDHVPDIATLRADFMARRESDAVDRLERLAMIKPRWRGDFESYLDLLVRQERGRRELDLAKTFVKIVHERIEVEEPGEDGRPRKLWLFGSADAWGWMERARKRLDADWALGSSEESRWVRADQLVEREQEWIWYGYLAQGKLTLVEGPSGVGKSTVVTDLAARLTAGAVMPGEVAGLPARDLVWITTEEEPTTDTLPRLRLAGADLKRVRFRAVDAQWDARKLDELLDLCEGLDNPVVVVDAIKDAMPGVKDYEEVSVRQHLLPMVRACHARGLTMIGIRHWKKGTGPASERGAGSIAWRALAYATLSVGKVGDETFVAADKLRGGLKGAPWQYVIEPVQELQRRRPTPRLRWVGARDDLTADDLAMAQPQTEEERSKLDEAKDFLREALGAGARRVKQVEGEARAAEISKATLRRARKAVCRRPEQRADGWYVELREPPMPAPVMAVPDLGLDDADDETGSPAASQAPPPASPVSVVEVPNVHGAVVEVSIVEAEDAGRHPTGVPVHRIVAIDGRACGVGRWIARRDDGGLYLDEETARDLGHTQAVC